jgi:hypothetical protein
MAALAQDLIVALIVGACAIYALWKLMPSAARRRLAIAVLRLPLPALLAAPLHRATQAASGCACDGCDRALPQRAPDVAQPVVFHPRQRR